MGAERPLGSAWTLRDRHARYVLFFSTYFYQGLVAGFSLTALANRYAGLGLSASEVGLHFALVGLPWTLQPFLWGPLIDRARRAAMGRRRIWSLSAILGAQLCLSGLCFVPGPPSIAWVSLVFFGHSVFASLLDTACDRLIMDHVPEAELGRMSGCTRGGFVMGTSLGAGLFAWLLSIMPFSGCALTLLALGTLALVPALLIREAPSDALLSCKIAKRDGGPHQAVSFGRFLKRLTIGLRRPAALRLIALCFSVDFALSLFELRFGVDLVQAYGWDAATLSWVQSSLALASGTFGALAIGLWADRSGPLRAMTGLFVASAVAFALSGLLIAFDRIATAGPAILALTNVLPSLIIVAFVPALMLASRGRAGAATQFEVFMAVMNLGSVAGGFVSGRLGGLSLASVSLFVTAVFLASAYLSRRPDLLFHRREMRP